MRTEIEDREGTRYALWPGEQKQAQMSRRFIHLSNIFDHTINRCSINN